MRPATHKSLLRNLAGVVAAALFAGGCVSIRNGRQDAVQAANESPGQTLLRFEMGTESVETELAVELTVEGGKLCRLGEYFFEQGEDVLKPRENRWKCRVTKGFEQSTAMGEGDLDVVVAWIDGDPAEMKIKVSINREMLEFSIDELLGKKEIKRQADGAYVSVNALRDVETGVIRPEDVGIKNIGEDFDFTVLCDTHVGQGHDFFNSFAGRCIERVNVLEPKPAFMLINGDATTGQGDKEHFEVLTKLLSGCEVPVLLEVGNHESRYGSRFEPGYNMDAFANFLEAQKQINGLEKILYSFDAGRWHFIVWPDPLRHHFWERHPHYFDWLEKDLRENKHRPTIFFQHIHSLPIGINPMTNYTNGVQVRRMLLDILTRHGNVKYVLSGHTHITLRASMKTAREYRGTAFVNLPSTFNPGRNFGEPDFGGQGSAGFAVVSIRGDEASMSYRTLDGTMYDYPSRSTAFEPGRWPLWLMDEWELPAGDHIVNGGFEKGLNGWNRNFVYVEDDNPSNICEPDSSTRHGGDYSLHMFCRRRGYYVPGDNRMTQTINTICQAVKNGRRESPLLRAWYLLDSKQWAAGDRSGACIRVDGYSGSSRRMRLCYWIGTGYFKPRGLWSPWEEYVHYDVTAAADAWHEVEICPKKDYERASESSYDGLELDRLVVTLQVWNLNQHTEQDQGKPMHIGVYFDDIEILPGRHEQISTVDGRPISGKRPDEIESRWLLSGMKSEENTTK